MRGGYLQIATVLGVAFRLHWTIPFGAMAFSRGRLDPILWAGFFFVIFLHEFGHAVLVVLLGHRVTSIDLTGFGGACHWRGRAPLFHRSIIATGGVVAQAALLVVAVVVAASGVLPNHEEVWRVVALFTWTNAFLIVVNLLPIPPLDGYDVWLLVPRGILWLAGKDRPAMAAPATTPDPSPAGSRQPPGYVARPGAPQPPGYAPRPGRRPAAPPPGYAPKKPERR